MGKKHNLQLEDELRKTYFEIISKKKVESGSEVKGQSYTHPQIKN